MCSDAHEEVLQSSGDAHRSPNADVTLTQPVQAGQRYEYQIHHQRLTPKQLAVRSHLLLAFC